MRVPQGRPLLGQVGQSRGPVEWGREEHTPCVRASEGETSTVRAMVGDPAAGGGACWQEFGPPGEAAARAAAAAVARAAAAAAARSS